MIHPIQRNDPFFLEPPLVNPLKWIADLVELVARKIFGTILRVTAFQLGEYKRPLSYLLMRIYQRATCDPKEESAVDRDRLEISKSLLLYFGGVETALHPADGEAIVRTMSFSSAKFFEKIDELGGEKRAIALGNEVNRFAIFPKVNADRATYKKLEKLLGKFFLKPITVNGITGILLPKSPEVADGDTAPIVARCHSPGRSMVMDRRWLGNHLAAGYDAVIWDPRGTIDSVGEPSEGGYYLDFDEVYRHIISLGYEPNKIWVSGYCEGAATAAYVKAKYHHLGVNFIAENPFNSMLDMALNQGFLGKNFAHICMPEIYSTNEKITNLVQQNGFDLEAWFRDLPPSEGKFLLIYTDNDTVVPAHSIARIKAAAANAGPCGTIKRVNPNPKMNGHMQPPSEDPIVWNAYVDIVC